MKWTRRTMDEDEEGQQDVWDNIFPQVSLTIVMETHQKVHVDAGLCLLFTIFSRTLLFRVETPVTDEGWSGWSDPGCRCWPMSTCPPKIQTYYSKFDHFGSF